MADGASDGLGDADEPETTEPRSSDLRGRQGPGVSAQGLDDDSVVNCDNLFTVPKTAIGRIRGELGPAQMHQLDAALAIALGLD